MDGRPLVLVAGDRLEFTRLVELSLGREGFRVESARDGPSALERVSEVNPDLLLLDVTLSGMSWVDVLRELRESRATPVILIGNEAAVSAVRDGLDHGADDFVVQPFHGTELAARIRAVLRRRRHLVGGQRTIGSAVIDLDSRRISIGNRQVGFGRVEWRLLEELLANEGRILLHEELLTRVWGPEYRDDVPYLRLWIGQLRRRLGIPAWEEGPIRTIQGMGYAYDPEAAIPMMRSRRPRSRTAGAERGGSGPQSVSRAIPAATIRSPMYDPPRTLEVSHGRPAEET